jgi:DNA-binding transcriptional regulator YiaG
MTPFYQRVSIETASLECGFLFLEGRCLMGFSDDSEGKLFYTLEIEINLLDFNTKYPKNPKNFGEMIRKRRMEMRLTMKDIAEKLGVSETTVYNWEIRNRKPYRRTEEKLRAILGLKEKVSI